MKIIEQFTEGKRSQEKNEDAIAVNQHFAAVIDGATNKSGTQVSSTQSNGRFAASLIREVILQLDGDATCENFCHLATSRIRQIYQENNLLERVTKYPAERLTASVILFSEVRREIWMIGDCQALLQGELLTNPKPLDTYLSGVRADFIHEKLQAGMHAEDFSAKDSGRAHIMPQLIDSCRYQNAKTDKDMSFSVVDGFNINMQKVVICGVPASVHEVVLASDGYCQLSPSLIETEHALKNQIQQDPLCINLFKTTKGMLNGNKSFDDRTYLRIGI